MTIDHLKTRNQPANLVVHHATAVNPPTLGSGMSKCNAKHAPHLRLLCAAHAVPLCRPCADLAPPMRSPCGALVPPLRRLCAQLTRSNHNHGGDACEICCLALNGHTIERKSNNHSKGRDAAPADQSASGHGWQDRAPLRRICSPERILSESRNPHQRSWILTCTPRH
jgi:hypothetical protein